MSEFLQCRDLSVVFRQDGKDIHAVRGIDFHIERGENVAIVGESGSGKSVTALSIVGLLPENALITGSAKYRGTEMIGAPESTLRKTRGNDISFIFQEPMTSLNPLHTIEKQIRESLSLHQGIEGAEAKSRIIELLRRTGIDRAEHRLKDYPHQLSGGQRQRIMIAMALANGPDLLIADEPTTALDVTIQAQILGLLAELQKSERMALLFITHDLNVVRKIADRVCVMQDGQIVEQGPKERIFKEPEHRYTKLLLDAEPSGSPFAAAGKRQDRYRDQRPSHLVPCAARLFEADSRTHQGREFGEHFSSARRNSRNRGRIGIRKDDAGASDPEAYFFGRLDCFPRKKYKWA